MGIISNLYLHEKSHRFCKAGNIRVFSMFCEPYFRFIITKGQKLLLALLIFRKTSWPSPLKILKPNLSLESRKKSHSNGIPISTMPVIFTICLELVPAVPGDAVQFCWYIRQQRSCTGAGSAEFASASVLQNRRKPGENLRK